MANTFIYALCEPGTRTVRYIGKANDPYKRLRVHLKKSRASDTHLGRWLRTLGEQPPNLVVLRQVSSDHWQFAEERYIRLARGCGMRLVNGTDGGDGVTMTPETVEKIIRATTGRPKSEAHREAIAEGKRGPKNHRFGRPTPPEVKEKLSLALRGEKNHNFGVKFSDERRAEISASLRGRTQSIETRAKRSAAIRAFHEARKASQI